MKTGMDPGDKYKPFYPGIYLENRRWPSNTTKIAPIWCSVDLRDGNQSLAVPMTIDQKIEFFSTLVRCGFKEIEVGFPAASETDFGFVRKLIEENLIPNDVTIQVLVQAREDLIKRTVESLIGAKNVIIHMYNSTSPAQRRIVFGLSKPEILQMAVNGTKWVKEFVKQLVGIDVRFEYSPESFSATETQFSLEVCEAVMDVWKPTMERQIILNLPDTVQMATSNVYADQIEWFCEHMAHREHAIVSLHVHNDRGTGVAATELGMLAGADRVEGTLFGNGERTGNADIITLAFNLYTQGIDPMLDFSHIDELREVYDRCTGMEVPVRQPYSGDLVDTAFSGSHQDAIRKGLKAYAFSFNGAPSRSVLWDVPYLPIDPNDKGREYREIIRVNGQSGKGGIAFLLESIGIKLPKDMQKEFGVVAGRAIDALGREVKAEDLKSMFWKEYIAKDFPYMLVHFGSMGSTKLCTCSCTLMVEGQTFNPQAEGNGPIDAFINSLRREGLMDVAVLDQSEHALGEGADAKAIAYVEICFGDGQTRWGAGVDTNIELASIRAIVSALNRK